MGERERNSKELTVAYVVLPYLLQGHVHTCFPSLSVYRHAALTSSVYEGYPQVLVGISGVIGAF